MTIDEALGRNALPPFAALRAFEAVFRTGGIRKAAASLGVDHAVVSRHLKAVEDWLGAPIINRSGNRLELTECGVQFHARISAALVEISLAARDVRGLERAGHLRLWCVPGLSIQWLSRQLAAFERRHADFTVELKPTDTPADLLRHEADADIRYVRDEGTQAPPNGIRSFVLARPEIMAVAHPDIAERLNQTRRLETLSSEALLHEENQAEWKSWLGSNGVVVNDELPGQLFWHAHLAIAAAKLGRGVVLASRFLVGAELESGELVEVLPGLANKVPLGSYTLFAREDRWSAPPLAELRRFLRQSAGELEPGAIAPRALKR